MIIPDWLVESQDIKPGLYFIGLGLGNIDSLSIKALNILKHCDFIFIDGYTNFFNQTIAENLQNFTQRNVLVINRQQLENDAIDIVMQAKSNKIGLLVSGDPFLATTHTTIRDLAIQQNIPYEIIHNASIFSVAVSKSGLSSYKFGKTPTIPFPEETESVYPYNVIKQNQNIGCHTLVLLDIEVKDAKFLDISRALEQILKLEQEIKKNVVDEDTLVIGLAKLGMKQEYCKAGSLALIKSLPWEQYGPPQCLIICSDLHFAEAESLNALFGLNLSIE